MQSVPVIQTERPRNIDAVQAAALLYGDWGTSKVYVVGLAFALAGYSAFWLILMVCILNVLVGLNYIIICKYYPNGGGVYASVRNRSEVMALLGGFFLICDYIITAALSAFATFTYLGVTHPELWACAVIAFIGLLNYIGPRQTGNVAFIISIAVILVVGALGLLSIEYIPQAIHATKPLSLGLKLTWIDFVGVIVALSGVEAIANMTGEMRLDPGHTRANPSVVKTSTPAIVWVMVEVTCFTALFGLAVNAIPGLTITSDLNIIAPGYENVRDAMLRYMGETFLAPILGITAAHIFGYVISIVFGTLLLSAVNTAIVAFNSILYIMAKDGHFPAIFAKTNLFGVPIIPLIFATLAPISVLLFVNDMESLANLYAIGFVGAIAMNLISTSTEFRLNLKQHERAFMFVTSLIMLAIEITLFIEKPHARNFVITVIAIGLLLRSLVLEQKSKKTAITSRDFTSKPSSSLKTFTEKELMHISKGSNEEVKEGHIHSGGILCATTHVGKTLEFALQESKLLNQKLSILFIREQKVMTPNDLEVSWLEDKEACAIFDYALDFYDRPNFLFFYAVSNAPATTVVEHVKNLNVSRVILGMPRTNKLLRIIRGNVVLDIFSKLPENVDLIIIS